MDNIEKTLMRIALKEVELELLKEKNKGAIIPELVFEIIANQIKKYE